MACSSCAPVRALIALSKRSEKCWERTTTTTGAGARARSGDQLVLVGVPFVVGWWLVGRSSPPASFARWWLLLLLLTSSLLCSHVGFLTRSPQRRDTTTSHPHHRRTHTHTRTLACRRRRRPLCQPKLKARKKLRRPEEVSLSTLTPANSHEKHAERQATPEASERKGGRATGVWARMAACRWVPRRPWRELDSRDEISLNSLRVPLTRRDARVMARALL